jgi:hypothetical protein
MTDLPAMRRALCAASLLALCSSLLPHADAQQHAVGARASQASALQEPAFHEHAFREQDYQQPQFLDARHQHDHYYPPVGGVFGELPQHYQVIYDPDGDLYFADGVWYRKQSPGRYVVVEPEIGIGVRALPPHCTIVMMGGVPYYYANNTYYLQSPSGYLVVDPADR